MDSAAMIVAIKKALASAASGYKNYTVSYESDGAPVITINFQNGDSAQLKFPLPQKGDTGEQGIQGEKGDKGDTPTIKIGNVTSGSSSSVTNSGTDTNVILDFVIEKGDKGDNGINAQIFVGTDISGEVDVIVDVATSNLGDLYINSVTSNVYKRTDKLGSINLWEKVGNIKGKEGEDAYQIAVKEGFIGTKAEWLASLTGEAKGSEIVWEKPNIHGSTIELGKWYYYKVNSGEYSADDAWLNRYEVPKNKDYTNGKYAFYDGIKYLCFSSDTSIPALTNKDTHDYYVLYDEKNNRCQGHIVELSTGNDTALNWCDVTNSLIVPDGYEEVTPAYYTQYGKWTQTIYLGSSKESAYDCTISTGTSVRGFISTEVFAQTIGALGDLTTTNKTNIVASVNEVNGKFDSYTAKTDIVDSLSSKDSTKPLSANQGKVLNDSLTAHIENEEIHVTQSDKDKWNDTVGILKTIYPIGSIYINSTDVNPSEILGFGTWERVAQDMTLWGTSGNGQVGTTKSAGLPNITGSFVPGSVPSNHSNYAKGAFSGLSSTSKMVCDAANATNPDYGYSFSASKSNSIYGNSNTVQPPALVVNIWKRTA